MRLLAGLIVIIGLVMAVIYPGYLWQFLPQAQPGTTITTQHAPVITTSSLPAAVVGQPYSLTFTASGGRAPYKWVLGNNLPGLQLDSSSGRLSGTPSSAGTMFTTLVVTDTDGQQVSRPVDLVVGTGDVVSASQPTTVPASPTQAPAAPTMAPRTGASPNCLDNGTFTSALNSNDVGGLIIWLDEQWDGSGGNIGQQSLKANWTINNPGPGGASLVWTNTNHRAWVMVGGQPVNENVFPLLTEGKAWGTFIVFAPVQVPSPGRSARLCSQVSDLYAIFPNAQALD